MQQSRNRKFNCGAKGVGAEAGDITATPSYCFLFRLWSFFFRVYSAVLFLFLFVVFFSFESPECMQPDLLSVIGWWLGWDS